MNPYYQPPPNKQYLHTVQAGAWLPFMQATITALVLGLGVFTLAILADSRRPWAWGLVVALLVWSVTWLLLQRHWFTLTAERLTGLDLDRDGTIAGQPVQPAEVRLRVSQVKDDGHYQENIYDLPGDLAQLQALAQGLLIDQLPFSERTWTGPGNAFSINQFRNLRSALIKRGLLAMSSQDHRQGFTLTAAGRHVLRGLLDASPTPHPPAGA